MVLLSLNATNSELNQYGIWTIATNPETLELRKFCGPGCSGRFFLFFFIFLGMSDFTLTKLMQKNTVATADKLLTLENPDVSDHTLILNFREPFQQPKKDITLRSHI